MKIIELLGASKEKRNEAKVKRVGAALKRNQLSLIDELEENREDAQGVIDELLEINIAKFTSEDKESFCRKYHDAKVNLTLVDKEIEIAKETLKELF